MILFRYLAKEVFTTLTVITLILMLIFLSNQFAHYLLLTAAGKMVGMQLLHLMILEVPQLLSLVLPLGFYLGLLLAYGRLYVDNEMVVMMVGGLGYKRLLRFTLRLASVVAFIVLLFTFWINPIVSKTRDELLQHVESASALQTLLPGRFQAVDNGTKVFYVEKMSADRERLKNIFVAEKSDNSWAVMSAEGGYHYIDPQSKQHYVVATTGNRYEGEPGTKNFTLIHYAKYGVRIDTPMPYINDQIDDVPTWQLWERIIHHDHPTQAAAELQWRISIPLCVFILSLLALPLSQASPRQGRFARLFPAILLYIVYANLLIMGQNWIDDGTLRPLYGLWIMHLGMLLIVSLLLANQMGWFRLIRYKLKNMSLR